MGVKEYYEQLEQIYNELCPGASETFKTCLYREYLKDATRPPTCHKNDER